MKDAERKNMVKEKMGKAADFLKEAGKSGLFPFIMYAIEEEIQTINEEILKTVTNEH